MTDHIFEEVDIMSERESGAVDFAAAFALGILFGAGIALLLAPKSGGDFKKGLRKRGERLKKDAGKQFGKAGERIRESGEDWLEDAEERLGELTGEIADAVEEGVKAIRATVSEEFKDIEKKLGRKKGLFR
jgi:gas vesicle protein